MKIINSKQEAIKELSRISSRTTSEKNNNITATVEKILKEVEAQGDRAIEKYTRNLTVLLLNQWN